MAKVAVVGSFVMDFIFETPRRPLKGESIIGKSFGMAPGGKGANQAMQAALMGAETHMIGRVGNDVFGDSILESLSRAGVNVECVIRDSAGTGCSGVILDSEGDNSIVMVPRANMACSVSDVDAAADIIRGADVLLLQLEIPMKVNARAVKIAKKAGVRIIMDPAPACPIEDSYYKDVTIMTPNETEARILSGLDVNDVAGAEAAARELAARGLRTAIITMGGNGTLLLDAGEAIFLPPVKVDVKDTTAAGDAFTGSLAVFLSEGKPLAEAAKLAGTVGALATTKYGAQPSLPDRQALRSFLGDNLI
ncbi:MAG TPA: ribokinase [bacterium]|nr:ribokinase [bacterium]